MIDEMTNNRLQISTDEIAGPYLMVSLAQLPLVRERLDRDSIRYCSAFAY